MKKFREGLNGRIRPLIIASGVDTFTEFVKRAMSLEEDFRYNPNSKESEKKQGPFNSQHGKGQPFVTAFWWLIVVIGKHVNINLSKYRS